MDHMIGKILANRYEILEKIGAGGMANVYKARCHVLNRYVAVKILKEEYKDEKEFLDRFSTEARAVALMSHPNIVAVYDVGNEEGLPYLVMELIEGITLKQYIAQKGALTAKEVIHFTYQILKALEHAHSRNIIHRDMKPQNIMLLRDGTIKVADFGIARFTLANTKTVTDTAIGSVHYISPEQAKGSVADQRADIYSVGVMMYKMLTGRLPFNGDNPVAVAIMHLRGEYPKPREINPNILPGLEEITLKAMCREPALRYQSATEMLEDIVKFRNNPTITFQHQLGYDEEQGTMRFKPPVEELRREPVRSQPQQARRSAPPRRRQEEEYEPQENRFLPLKIMAICIGIALILAIGFFAINSLMNVDADPTDPDASTSQSQEEEIEVPKIEGLAYDKVLENEQYEQFVIVQESTKFDENVEPGIILNQTPAAGEMVAPGSEIRVVVSKGAETVIIEDVSGRDYESAAAKLEAQGLKPNRQEAYHDTIPAGSVIETRPGNNTEVTVGSTVQVYVSRGPEPKLINTPNVVGKELDEAVQELSAAGFVVKTQEKFSDKSKGEVLEQTIAAGTQVEEKSEITITYSKGPESYTYDYYINLPSEPAEYNVRIEVGGVEQFNQHCYARDRTLHAVLKGSGTQSVEVFIDGELYPEGSKTVQFS
ncbi:MAG: Stk1 family PASTA domain-containing Ser/Thr kinase [Eubacteriales bacterium]|jgi:serine/threonine protein kinase/beta-lactam-binding protein with PASTA domain